MVKVLFVCLGNICRSPLAEGILQNDIRLNDLGDKLMVDSCGTSAYHIGEQPDGRTVKNAAENGVFLNHKARQFSKSDFREFDYILVMDQANMDVIIRHDMNKNYVDKLHLMRDFDPEFKGEDVPDPYFGGEAGFQHVFDIIKRSVNNFFEYLREKENI